LLSQNVLVDDNGGKRFSCLYHIHETWLIVYEVQRNVFAYRDCSVGPLTVRSSAVVGSSHPRPRNDGGTATNVPQRKRDVRFAVTHNDVERAERSGATERFSINTGW
jgi:hypothetical protein